MKRILLCLSLFIAVLSSQSAVSIPHSKTVLVTGASSGIGRKITETLAAKGVFVFAGARKQADIDALSAIKNVQGVRLDVTKPDEIAAAVALIEKRGLGLNGLVNNAGVFLHAPLIEVSEDDMQFIMDVNVFGPYRITKAFAPLIVKSGGRITTIGSIAGLRSGSMFGPYSMTKYAMEAYTDALAAEMSRFSVHVSIIEPGNFKSNIMDNMHKRRAKMSDRGEKTLFKEEYERLLNFSRADRSKHKEPDAVADAVFDALFAKNAKRRYLVAPNQIEADFALRAVFDILIEINKGHEYSKKPAALRSMLDKAME